MNQYKLKNGATIEGTLDQILNTAKLVGETVDISRITGEIPKGFYKSSTDGLVKIESLGDQHLKNALLKKARTFFESKSFATLSNTAFLAKFTTLDEDSEVVDLFTELSKRK